MAYASLRSALILLNGFAITVFFYLSQEASNTEIDLYARNTLKHNTTVDEQHVQKTSFDKPTNQPRPEVTRAVIHMGIHKTGTSTIQKISARYKDKLMEDGYEMPWVGFSARTGISLDLNDNQVNFASCFFLKEDEMRRRCVPQLLKSGKRIAERKNNIFVTAEIFSKMTNSDEIKRLSNYCNSNWDHTNIIIYYRRYYDYLYSVFDQTRKKKGIDEISLLDFLMDEIEHGPRNTYIVSLLTRLKQNWDNTKNNTNIL